MRYIKPLQVVTIEPCFILSCVVFVTHYFSLPQLLMVKICERSYNEAICSSLSDYHDIQNDVQAESALWIMIIGLSTAVPSIFVVLMIGPISDIIGRKIFLVVVPGVLALHSISLILNSNFMFLHMWYLIPGFFFPVVVGNFQGIILLSYAYIAHVTLPGSERTMRMALVGGSLTISIAIAGFLSGYVIDNHGYTTLYVISLTLCSANALYTIFFLPTEEEYLEERERLKLDKLDEPEVIKIHPKDARAVIEDSSETDITDQETDSKSTEVIRRKKSRRIPNPVESIKNSLAILMEPEQKKRRILLLTAFGFTILAILGEVNVIILYLKHAPFNFTAFKVGLFLAGSQILRGFGGMLIPQIILRLCPTSDFLLAAFGFLSKIITDIFVAFSFTDKMLIASLFMGIGGALPSICLRSAISKTVKDQRFGTVLCLLAAVNELFIVISDIVATNIYRWTVGWFPGFQFLVSATFCTVGLGIVLFIQCSDMYKAADEEKEELLGPTVDEIG